MKIIDTTEYFLENYKPTISFLKGYYDKYPKVFQEYFLYHCKDTEERLLQSISKYEHDFERIRLVRETIVSIIERVELSYKEKYDVEYPLDVNLLIGGYGSNAYTYREIIPDISFALEKLSPEINHLEYIVAHEFGHATHNIVSDKNKIDWTIIDWGSPITWLNQEGAATHLSRRAVPNLLPHQYFSYDVDGAEWLSFARNDYNDIKNAFREDYQQLNFKELFYEWFSINGGKRFEHTRLAYFLADDFFQYQIATLGEIEAIAAWGRDDFKQMAEKWLYEL
ncbi:hypothetical protein MKZ08_00980 [Viridibacillus sp. FSL R5-0477]|uniref:Uncharacterized protein n=2 Tax=Viridibacillus TaxID=496496 RepID=W4ET95_9BACL|nr:MULTISPECIES: hypothetical protein [Viridibacillus]ETT83021.1 hypothetical protein C176_13967 [Viridibacillus arenosi FSL R5-213]OMC82038.1 hypothetical protein BK130_12115 [Viridibacillus sp. FSL H8-0123]OMC86196.1 hypothetical protein BK128_11835 [Viridibacillus sp. FSL H7-0596]OMC90901.1 hypothetical protein BK137_11795 [Viridibacillus arenosi]